MFSSQFKIHVKSLLQAFGLFLFVVGLAACGGDSPSPTPTPTPEAKFSIDKQSLDFGKVTAEISFKVKNTGDADLTWSTTTSANWLTIIPANGTVAKAGEQTIKVQVDRSKLNAGENTTTVTVSAKQGDKDLSGSPATITVKATK